MRSPFDTLESAHEYVRLLAEQVQDVRVAVQVDVAEVASASGGRRLDALRLVDFKLAVLERSLVTSRRALNDLRTLRRILLGERDDPSPSDDLTPAVPTEGFESQY